MHHLSLHLLNEHRNLRLDVEVYKEQLESMFLDKDAVKSTWVDEFDVQISLMFDDKQLLFFA